MIGLCLKEGMRRVGDGIRVYIDDIHYRGCIVHDIRYNSTFNIQH